MPILMPTESRFPSTRNSYSHPNGMSIHIDRNTHCIIRSMKTSHVERQNLTIRMSMRRLTRLTNAFSKKWENLWAAYCLHFAWYNFVRVHKMLRGTPAMASGITERVWD